MAVEYYFKNDKRISLDEAKKLMSRINYMKEGTIRDRGRITEKHSQKKITNEEYIKESSKNRKEKEHWETLQRLLSSISAEVGIYFSDSSDEVSKYEESTEVEDINVSKIILYLEKNLLTNDKSLKPDLEGLKNIFQNESARRQSKKMEQRIEKISNLREKVQNHWQNYKKNVYGKFVGKFKTPYLYEECMEYIGKVLEEAKKENIKYSPTTIEEPNTYMIGEIVEQYKSKIEEYKKIRLGYHLSDNNIEEIDTTIVTNKIKEIEDIQLQISAIENVLEYLKTVPFKNDYQNSINELNNLKSKLVEKKEKMLEQLKEEKYQNIINKITTIIEKEEKKRIEEDKLTSLAQEYSQMPKTPRNIRMFNIKNGINSLSQEAEIQRKADAIKNGERLNGSSVEEKPKTDNNIQTIEQEALQLAQKEGYISSDKKIEQLDKREKTILYSYVRQLQDERAEKFNNAKSQYESNQEHRRESYSVGNRNGMSR